MKHFGKKVLGSLLALIMVVALIPTTVFAANMAVTVGSAAVDNKADTRVTIPVKLENNAGISLARITLSFDTTALQLVKVVDKQILGSGFTFTPPNVGSANKTAYLSLLWMNPQEEDNVSTASGTVAELTFKVLEGAENGAKDITATVGATDMLDGNNQGIACTTNSGKITLNEVIVPVKSVNLTAPSSTTLKVGKNSAKMSYALNPTGATEKNVTWNTSNAAIATVENGVVTGKGTGTVKISVTVSGVKSNEITFTITCNHPTDQRENFSESAADCTHGARPAYQQCKLCKQLFDASGNEIDKIPETGKPLGHDFTKEDVTNNNYLKSAANCHAKAVYFKSCTRCGLKGTETFEYGNVDSTNHVGDKTYTSNYDDTHEVICASCNTVINAKEAHIGGTATCTEQAKCAKCGAAYGPLADHEYDTKWTSDSTKHWHECTVCKTATTAKEDHDLTAATCQTPATCKTCGWNDGKTVACTPCQNNRHASDANKHWQVCQWCGKKINENDHTWNKPAEGEAEYCTVCGYVKKAATTPCGENQHSRITHLAYDATNHYEICSTCGEKIHSEKHTFGPETTVNGKKYHSCKECGYTEEIKTVTPPTTPTGNNPNAKNPYEKNDTTKKDNGKTVESGRTFDAGIALYVGLSVLSVTGGALVIGKKKEF